MKRIITTFLMYIAELGKQ